MQRSRVLIVEDERIIVLDLTERLKRFGCEVIGSCASADEAIAVARREIPDLVLMDIMLSGERDGIDAATELRKELGIPVVFLTAYSDDAVLERAKVAEPYGFIIKPFKERELYGTIELAVYKADTEKRLQSHERLLDSILMTIGEAVISVDSSGIIRFSNPSTEELLGRNSKEIVGLALNDVVELYSEGSGERIALLPTEMDAAGTYLIDNLHLKGAHDSRIVVSGSVSVVPDNTGETSGYTIALRDVSDLRRITDTLSYQVTHDSLTGLLNRDELITRMSRELTAHPADDGEETPHYLYADLDNFKVVNDVCGHAAGDELLRQIATDICETFPEVLLRARIGDDEYGLLLPKCTPAFARQRAQDLCDTISRRFEWRGHSFPITASIALVSIAGVNADPFGVLAAADDACYMVKDGGGNGIKLYEKSDQEFLKRRGDMHWASLLSKAIDEDRFLLYFQPIVDLSSGLEVRREVLIRLIDDSGQIVTPGRFIPAAESYNLMPAIDRLILRKVVEFVSRETEQRITYCINLSGSSLIDDTLFDYVLELFREFRVSADRFCLEITETSAIRNFNTAVTLINRLREIGCVFALDDFGNGFSSFAYLKNLPVEALKIDGSFVQHVADTPADRAMVEAINSIGHVLGMTTIAEFVKDGATWDALREIGVDLAQGYLIATPQPLNHDQAVLSP